MPAPSEDRPHTDLVTAYPVLAALDRAIAAKDWDAIAAFFDALRGPDEISVAGLLGRGLAEDFLESIATGGHHRSLARLLLANHYIDVGWQARTGARAKHVTQAQFTTFRKYLCKAEQILLRLTAEEPDNVPAWELRLTTARGLDCGLAEARRRYRQAAKSDPHSYRLQSTLLQELAPKWRGSFEVMHTFAKECAEAGPEGSLCPAIVAEAHVEHWLELPDDEGTEYLRQPAVQEETAAAAARSVLHPAYQGPVLGAIEAHNAFAFVFSIGGNPAAAAPHFQAVGLSYRGFSWCYVNDSEASFLRFRAAALGGE